MKASKTSALPKLGKAPRRYDSRTLRLARYLDHATLPPAPPELNLAHLVPSYPMDANDRYGDCTIAGVHHLVQTQRANDRQAPLAITEGDVTKQYFDLSGGADEGLVELDVLKIWKKKGLFSGRTQISAFAAVNLHSLDELKTAIYLFGGIYLGVELPVAWQNASKWTLPKNLSGDNAPGSWGGHCVIGVNYGADFMDVVTWGKVLRVSLAAVGPYFSEGYAIISPDWLGADDTAPNGFKAAQLLTDLAAL